MNIDKAKLVCTFQNLTCSAFTTSNLSWLRPHLPWVLAHPRAFHQSVTVYDAEDLASYDGGSPAAEKYRHRGTLTNGSGRENVSIEYNHFWVPWWIENGASPKNIPSLSPWLIQASYDMLLNPGHDCLTWRSEFTEQITSFHPTHPPCFPVNSPDHGTQW